MKAMAFRVMLAIVAMLTVTNTSAVIKKTVYNNDTVENGLVVAREVCAEEGGALVFISRSEMEYTADGQLAVKRDYTWNETESTWTFSRLYTYTYSDNGFVITVTDANGRVRTFDYTNNSEQ